MKSVFSIKNGCNIFHEKKNRYKSICEHFGQTLRSCFKFKFKSKFNTSNAGSLPDYKGDVYKKWILRNMLHLYFWHIEIKNFRQKHKHTASWLLSYFLFRDVKKLYSIKMLLLYYCLKICLIDGLKQSRHTFGGKNSFIQQQIIATVIII